MCRYHHFSWPGVFQLIYIITRILPWVAPSKDFFLLLFNIKKKTGDLGNSWSLLPEFSVVVTASKQFGKYFR